MMKNTIVVLGVALLMSGVILAIAPTAFTHVSESRWSGVTAGNDTTEGGNITNGDIGTTVLTEKWAAYFGDVSGDISLWDGTDSVYTWTVGTVVGEMCASQNSTFSFATATGATGAQVDSVWAFTTADVDSATNTFANLGTCALDFTGLSTINTDSLTDDAAWDTCVIDDGAVNGEGHFAFCVALDDAGTDYAGNAANYELMVPTTETAGASETYYFYLELN